MRRLLSLAHLSMLDADPVALIDAGATGGFDAVGLRIVPARPWEKIVPVIGDVALQRRIKTRLAETGLKILDVEAIWLDPESNVDDLSPALDVAVNLGVRSVLTVGNDPDRNRLIDNFSRLCAAARSRRLRIMLEFIPYTALRNIAAAAEVVAAAAAEDTGILVDALHLSRSGGSPVDIARYDPVLFSCAHFCDAPRALPPFDKLREEATGVRLYPGDGELWLSELLDALPPGIPLGIEAPGRAPGLSLGEHARRINQATRALVDRYEAEGARSAVG